MPKDLVVDDDPDSAIQVRLGDSLSEVEERLILHTVRHCRTQEEAARILGVSTKTLYNKLRQYQSRRRQDAGKVPNSEQRPDADRA